MVWTATLLASSVSCLYDFRSMSVSIFDVSGELVRSYCVFCSMIRKVSRSCSSMGHCPFGWLAGFALACRKASTAHLGSVLDVAASSARLMVSWIKRAVTFVWLR